MLSAERRELLRALRAGATVRGAKATLGRGFRPLEVRRPRQITLMRRAGRIGDGVGASTRWVVVQELQRAGVELLTGVEYERIEPDAVIVRRRGRASGGSRPTRW